MIIHDEFEERNTLGTEIETAIIDIPDDLLEAKIAVKTVISPFQRIIGFITKPKVYGLLVIVLLSLISFGLGRISALEENSENLSVTLDTSNQQAQVLGTAKSIQGEVSQVEVSKIISNLENQSGSVVASKSGTKYHYPWCSGAKRITETNKVTFSSIEQARIAGYLPATNCKGLK